MRMLEGALALWYRTLEPAAVPSWFGSLENSTYPSGDRAETRRIMLRLIEPEYRFNIRC